MNNENFKQSVSLREITFCPKNHPEYIVNEEVHCEINIFIHEDGQFHKCTFQKYHSEIIWIELTTFNQWLFSVKNIVTLKYECGDYVTRSYGSMV